MPMGEFDGLLAHADIVSVCYRIFTEWFDDRTVSTNPFYTTEGDIRSILPFGAEDLESIIREVTHDPDYLRRIVTSPVARNLHFLSHP
jgi:hypothetical protein